MLQHCVPVRDKEISSCKATVSCSLRETSLNHQQVSHNGFSNYLSDTLYESHFCGE